MAMKNPSHPGGLVRENLEDLGLSVAEAATALGITRQQLYNIVNCRSAITSEMALRLEKALGGSAELWLRMQVNYDLAQARKRSADLNISRLQPKVA
jgi:addiction module HigA family antidote